VCCVSKNFSSPSPCPSPRSDVCYLCDLVVPNVGSRTRTRARTRRETYATHLPKRSYFNNLIVELFFCPDRRNYYSFTACFSLVSLFSFLSLSAGIKAGISSSVMGAPSKRCAWINKTRSAHTRARLKRGCWS